MVVVRKQRGPIDLQTTVQGTGREAKLFYSPIWFFRHARGSQADKEARGSY